MQAWPKAGSGRPVSASGEISRPSAAPRKMRLCLPWLQYATPRFTPPDALGWVIFTAAYGSYFQISRPVAASRQTTLEAAVVRNILPARTIGVHSMVVVLPASPV